VILNPSRLVPIGMWIETAASSSAVWVSNGLWCAISRNAVTIACGTRAPLWKSLTVVLSVTATVVAISGDCVPKHDKSAGPRSIQLLGDTSVWAWTPIVGLLKPMSLGASGVGADLLLPHEAASNTKNNAVRMWLRPLDTSRGGRLQPIPVGG